MLSPDKLKALLDEYQALAAAQRARALTEKERGRLELLKDVLLEEGALLEAEEANRPARQPRAAVSLEVAFHTASDAARSWTRDLSVGGLAIGTDRPLPLGTVLSLQVKIPGWPQPLKVSGEVMWSKPGAMGISFRDLTPEDERRIKQLLLDNTSLLSRIGSLFGGAGKSGQPVPANVSVGDALVVRLADAVLADVAAELLGLHGYLVLDGPTEGHKPSVVVADLPSLAWAVSTFPSLPLVSVNLSGPDALVGKLSLVRPVAWVKRPATAAKILEAVRNAIRRT